MKTIVETIQQEQDVAIRDMENDLLMVQGAAGSGKTSIALHRAAYLMYQRLQANLSADNTLSKYRIFRINGPSISCILIPHIFPVIRLQFRFRVPVVYTRNYVSYWPYSHF